MNPKKLSFQLFKLLFPGCLKDPKTQYQNPKIHASNHNLNSQRISLSELSNPGSPLSMSDLSNSIFNLHVFSLKEMEMATRKFSKSNFLGEGGFGSVFKGFISHNLRPGLVAQPVAVKVLDLDGSQGHREWLAEVIFLGQLKDDHLVNLIGYCCEDEHRLLVYEYMERGNLETQLFKRYSGALPWLTRLKIALEAAKGLAFLHKQQPPVIYRDFKASNVLLDADLNAKLSDFGLATDGPQGDKSHITTRVMGTEGYAAPEYIMTGHLTTQSDVFSFGVVLLELITGRRSVDKNRPPREQNLVKWARPLLKDNHKLHQIMDPTLEGQYSVEGARKAAALAHQCLSYQCKSRPTMANVVKTLEALLEFNDIPIGNFVYIAPSENNQNQKQIVKQEVKDLDPNPNRNQKRRRRGRRHGKKIKSMSSKGFHSDTVLYKTLGTDLYSCKVQNFAN